jgi:hypothetical protein
LNRYCPSEIFDEEVLVGLGETLGKCSTEYSGYSGRERNGLTCLVVIRPIKPVIGDINSGLKKESWSRFSNLWLKTYETGANST